MRFGLRFIFALTAVFGVYFGIAMSAGYLVSTGIVLLLIMIISTCWARCTLMSPRKVIAAKGFVIACSLTGLWFLAVDWSWFVNSCPDCGVHQHSYQLRIIGIPLHTLRREDKTWIAETLKAIGHPCTHEDAEYWHKHRLWGLCSCRWPCINGIMGLTYEEDEEVKAALGRLEQVGRENPALAAEVHRRVTEDDDYTFWRRFVEDHAFAHNTD